MTVLIRGTVLQDRETGMRERLAIRLPSLIFLVAGVATAQSQPPQKDIPTIAKAANGAIVSIITSDENGKPIAQGTGFLVSTDGRIVTNYHVIEGASSAIVKVPDGAFYDVDGVLAFDKARDLAVIKAHGQNFHVVILGNSDRVQVGEEVVAIGSPLSLESTVSSGIVSGIRNIEEEGGKFLQITAPISPGSSGGPVFNMSGEVVGITTLYLKNGENLNFAIPINDAKPLISVGSKVQDFPVEIETHAEVVSPPSVSPATARGYYKQLYDAGGILDRFVCFHDDPSLQWFFTFTLHGYDERWDTAFKAHLDALRNKTKDDTEAWQTMRSIEASRPIVDFMTDEGLSTWDIAHPLLATYLRSGGLVLDYSEYYKGVSTEHEYYAGTGNLWTFDLSPSLNETDKLLLTFEPTTLRYVMRASGRVLLSGTCEKIPAKQSN
jgi:trypsin-like peptidase